MPHSTFPIFVSSLCRQANFEDLRAKLFHDIGYKKYIYIDEQVNHRNIHEMEDLEVADELIRRVREADTFICILGGSKHGSAIKIGNQDSNVSFFEIELFQAALLHKEIHVYIRDDFSPEPNLKNLLQILQFAFPELASIKRMSEHQILINIKQVIEKTINKKKPISLQIHPPARRFVQALYTARSRNAKAPLLFCTSSVLNNSQKPRIEILQSIAQEVQLQLNEELRLSRLWIGLRELFGYHYSHNQNSDLFIYWNLFLNEWSRAGKWYGLHADTPLGCLAALNTVAQFRKRMSISPIMLDQSFETNFPGGALASAKYSIAKRLYIKTDRIALFNSAIQDIHHSLIENKGEKSGLYAIRGSIFRQLGKMSDCIRDYERVLAIRKQINAPVNEIGEAMCELGFGYLYNWRLRAGLKYCQAGVELLQNHPGHPGFLARGLRKLSIAYLVNGKISKAIETKEKAINIAKAAGAFDQIKL